MLATMVAAGSQALVAVPAQAQSKALKELPALASEPAPKPAPYIAAGDFTNPPPHPDQLEARAAEPKPPSFDPARSTADDTQTTATERVWDNPDGTKTVDFSTRPLRYQIASGAWREFDLSVVANRDGTLGAKDAPGAATLGATADADVATVATSAGSIVLRHPDAAPVAGTATKEGATYLKALPGGRDLVLTPTPDGVEQTVVLHDAAAPASYREQLVLPAGVTARNAEGGVELVDAAGQVVATMANGWAFDASAVPGPAGTTPVAVRLVDDPVPTETAPSLAVPDQKATPAPNVVTVEVSIDPAFVATPGRAFPVRVDPTIFTQTAGASGARDTFVSSGFTNGEYATTAFGTHPWLLAGSDAVHLSRSLLFFNLSGLPKGPAVNVTSSTLRVWNWYTAAGTGCAATPVSAYGLAGTFTNATTWMNQPGVEGAAMPASFAHNDDAGSACPGNFEIINTTPLASRWLHDGATNNGIGLRAGNAPANETAIENYHGFLSTDYSAAVSPLLSITYNRLPAMATANASASPANGSRIMTTTPTLAVNAATDPDGDTVWYWFRGTANTVDDGDGNGDAETGLHAIESGWQQATSFTVPAGSLIDGLTYSWHTWTWDYQLFDSWTAPNWEWAFTVDLHLGAEAAAPYDAIGPAQVNLVSGNLMAAAGSPAGLGYTYNSSTPPVTGAATGSYFNDVNNNDLLDDAVVMERRDPTIGFAWGSGGPGGGVWADNFLVRWTASVTVPVAASYKFFASSDDGVRVWVRKGAASEVLVLDRWGPGANVQGTYATPVAASAGETLSLRVEYMETTASAFANVWIEGPYGPSGATKLAPLDPSWLGADTPPLPVGWTFSAGLAYASARVVDDHVVLTDASGAPHVYSGRAGGYVPPPDEDGVLALDATGALTLHAQDGYTYAFDAGGRIASATAPTDDVSISSRTYDYVTNPGKGTRLVKITDAVSGRSMDLDYQSFDENLALPNPDPELCAVSAGFGAPPPYALCRIDYWDPARVVKTHLRYVSYQLAQIEDPGAVASPATANAAAAPVMTDFSYAGGKLSAIRSALAYDAVKAGALTGVGDNDKAKTLVTYAAGRAASVALPVPNSGAAMEQPRTVHRYTYPSATSSAVSVDGLTGANRTVGFDAFGRMTTDTDATGQITSMAWDAGDRLVSLTDPAGRRTVTTYDGDAARLHPSGRATESFGPAPAATCFSGLVPTCATTMPHTATAYDADGPGAAWTGLAATFWNSRALTGANSQPKAHDLVALVAGSPLSAPLPAGLAANAWSARYTGELSVATAGAHGFALSLTGGGRLFVDDVLVVDASGDRASTAVITGTVSPSLSVGRHRLRLDYVAPTTGTAAVELRWSPPGAPSAAVPAASVAPRYSMATRTTTDDRPSATTRVTATAYGAPVANALVATSTADVGGLGLVSAMEYLDAANLHRPSARYGPGASAQIPASGTDYGWWAPSEISAGTCAGAEAVAQAGALKSLVEPAQAGGARRVTTYVHDWAGRVAESTVGGERTCATYDGRGRVLKVIHPAHTNANVTPNVVEPGRTVTYDYAAGGAADVANDGDPRISTVIDPAGTITTTVDLLGRVVRYADVWGQATTYAYDQPGRLIRSEGPAGRRDFAYDNAGRTEAEHLADPGAAQPGPVVADPAYANGELASALYANKSSLAVGRDGAGRTTALTWTGVGGSAIAADTVARSQSGRVIDESIDGADAHVGDNFTYDGVGRLSAARVPGQSLTYGYGANGATCAFDPVVAGRNGNRTEMTLNDVTTTYCHDSASRLVASSDAAVGAPSYDARGNTTILGAQGLLYDGADRHTETRAAGGATVRYGRDATGRIVARTEAGTVTRYGHAGPGDSSSFTLTATNEPLERSIGLAGGVLLTKRAGLLGVNDVWSYPNVHGDVVATASTAGLKVGATVSYDPFGVALATLPDNSPGDFDYGWLGQHQRPSEHAPGIATIEMGARQYVPGLGRFLSVDPVDGGSCNDYDYVCGDPVNATDVAGTQIQVATPPRAPVQTDIGSFDKRAIEDVIQADREPAWKRYGLSRCPTKNECKRAVKLLKGAIGYADDYGKKLSNREKGRLKGLISTGEITIDDAPWLRPVFDTGLWGNLPLKTIREICKERYGGKW